MLTRLTLELFLPVRIPISSGRNLQSKSLGPKHATHSLAQGIEVPRV